MRPLTRVLLLTLLAMVVACSSDEGDRAPAASPTPSIGPGRTEEGVSGPLAPRAKSSEEKDKHADTGQEVFITDDGFVPELLYAIDGAEIRIVNETDSTKEIRFVNLAGTTLEPIPSGAYASFTPPGTVSIVFELADDDDVRGRIQVSPYYEPGETAEPTSTG